MSGLKARLRAQLMNVADAVPPIRRLRTDRTFYAHERDRLLQELTEIRTARYGLYPLGHFASPIPDLDAVKRDASRVFTQPDELAGIDLRTDAQRDRLESIAQHWSDAPYYRDADPGLRYQPGNQYFTHMDGLVLFGMLMTLEPLRYFEIGSGWSSALVLDTRERFLDRRIECTFIEPHTARLNGLLKPEDRGSVQIIEQRVEQVDPATFDVLEAGDILFIDSSHVSKVGSDVNFLFFEVLPRLRPGVWVHVHDIGYPFEYSHEWIFEGRAWNEAYLLHAVLIENTHWNIELWCDYLCRKHADALLRQLPASAQADGLSLWLRRT